MTGTGKGEYERGREAGGVEQRLRGVEEHLVRNNGSIAEQVEQAKEMMGLIHVQTLAIQRLTDQLAANAKQDDALTNASQHRRSESERSWSLAARFTIVAGVLLIAVVVVLLLVKP